MAYLIRIITRLLSWTLVLLALVVVGLRVSLANIDYFEAGIKSWLASEVSSGISFVGIQGDWNRFNPILRLENASLVLPNRDQPLSIDEMAVELDLIKSLWLQTLSISEISGSIKNLNFRKDRRGQWWLNGFSLAGAGDRGSKTSFASLISQFPYYLDLELKQLVIFDQTSGQNYQIDRVQLDLQQHDDSFHLKLVTDLPDPLGGQLTIKSIVKPDHSQVYLKSSRLELVRFAELFDINTFALQAAELSGEFWINFLGNQIVELDGSVSVKQGLVQTEQGNEAFDFALSSQISVRQSQGRWTISSQIDDLQMDNKVLRPFNSEIRITTNTGQTRIEGWVDAFELYNLSVFDQRILPAKLANTLQQSELQGQLTNVWFSFEPNDIDNLLVTADASNIAMRPVNGIPGFSNLGGSFVIGKKNAGLELGGSQMMLDFADQFRAPFEIEVFKLKAYASLIDKDFLMSIPSFEVTNKDLGVEGRVWMEVNQADKPFLYLRAKFANAIGSSTSKYVPVKLMPKKAVDWVDQGIRAADVAAGDLLYHGRLKHIKTLVKNRAGELVVDFGVENAEVMFDPKWAIARNGAGRVVFHNLGVDVALDTVSYDGIENGSANISIADFQHVEIKVDVDVDSSTKAAVQTWIKTPVGAKYESISKKLRNIKGSVKARIGILLPISDQNKANTVDIKLSFKNSAFQAPAWGLDLTGINGELQITEQSLMAKAMEANFFGDPVVVDIGTDHKNDQTIVQARGHIKSQKMLVLLPDYLKSGFQGSSDWQVKLGIANNPARNLGPIVQINANSNLLDTEILFPIPFSKAGQSSRPATLQVSIFDNDWIDFNLHYGSNIKARGRIKADNRGGYRLHTLGLGFSTPIRAKTSPGIKIYGLLRQLPLDEWIDYYQSRIESEGASASDLIALMDGIDLEVKSASIFGNDLTDLYLNMRRSPAGFSADIESSMLKGKIDLPLQHSSTQPIVANLEYLRLQSSESDSESTGLLPQDLFNLRLHSKLLSYDNMVFTDLQLDTRIDDDELTIDKLAFRHDKVLLSSGATWQYTTDTKQHRSAVNISITGQELGQTMAALGLGDALLNGEVNLDGQVRWSGELLHLDWESLVGDARLELTKGVLKNVDPGSGRIVGLMSLSALPRRLSLDFKDVLLEGMDFDKITGTYTIEGENLYTSNTSMQGPSAKVRISGRTGLLARDYDQKLIIIPRIRSTLPVVGALAVGTTVGWGLLLLQNLFKDVIDKSVEVEYRVTGTWDDPRLDLVKKIELKKIERNVDK